MYDSRKDELYEDPPIPVIEAKDLLDELASFKVYRGGFGTQRLTIRQIVVSTRVRYRVRNDPSACELGSQYGASLGS